jgi:hypothetical protein
VPRWLSKRVLLGVAGAVLIVATFAYLLPTIADYRDVWRVVQGDVVGVGAGAGGDHGDQHPDLRASVAGAPARVALLDGADDDPDVHALSIVVPGGAAVGIATAYALLRRSGFAP